MTEIKKEMTSVPPTTPSFHLVQGVKDRLLETSSPSRTKQKFLERLKQLTKMNLKAKIFSAETWNGEKLKLLETYFKS